MHECGMWMALRKLGIVQKEELASHIDLISTKNTHTNTHTLTVKYLK